ncbi:GNAT family N-acetyltransferase [Spirillospora sp. CA-294931]|uniref:GNAT family N-acetyltransferase n=1 Tax=Spirillospora sp. CA-294931 TaxID=3240042 RepID=UPI003D8DE412
MDFPLRQAEPRDHPHLSPIEESADGLFHPLGIVFPSGPAVIEQMLGSGAEILVAGDPPVAYTATQVVDGLTHLEQISVHADHVRQGIGTRLLDAVVARAAEAGSPAVTLLTFRDVPWNAPWYARQGFAEFPRERWGPGLRRYWEAEIKAGLHELGPRVAMYRELGQARA